VSTTALDASADVLRPWILQEMPVPL